MCTYELYWYHCQYLPIEERSPSCVLIGVMRKWRVMAVNCVLGCCFLSRYCRMAHRQLTSLMMMVGNILRAAAAGAIYALQLNGARGEDALHRWFNWYQRAWIDFLTFLPLCPDSRRRLSVLLRWPDALVWRIHCKFVNKVAWYPIWSTVGFVRAPKELIYCRLMVQSLKSFSKYFFQHILVIHSVAPKRFAPQCFPVFGRQFTQQIRAGHHINTNLGNYINCDIRIKDVFYGWAVRRYCAILSMLVLLGFAINTLLKRLCIVALRKMWYAEGTILRVHHSCHAQIQILTEGQEQKLCETNGLPVASLVHWGPTPVCIASSDFFITMRRSFRETICPGLQRFLESITEKEDYRQLFILLLSFRRFSWQSANESPTVP